MSSKNRFSQEVREPEGLLYFLDDAERPGFLEKRLAWSITPEEEQEVFAGGDPVGF